MDSLVSRYRERIMDSSSQIKALSASRQKSLTNQSFVNPIPNISSTESLKKSKNLNQTYTNQKQTVTEEILPKANSQLPIHKSIASQSMSLPPQPQSLSTNKKQKKKITTNTLNPVPNQPLLKSSRRINDNQIHQKEKEKQKSKNKKVSRTPKKILITPELLKESFGESILDVFISDLKEKNAPSNLIALINKEDLKQKVKLLLEQYFVKRLQCLEKQRSNIINSEADQVQRSNRQMAQSYIVNQGQNVLLTNQNASSLSHLPQTLSKRQLSVKKALSTDIEKRLFETQKERQYLQNKVQTLSKRIQNLTKDLEKYSKMQRLINNTIESENESRREVTRLRKELEVSELKNTEQQKIWRKEVGEMKDVIMELKNQLYRAYENKN